MYHGVIETRVAGIPCTVQYSYTPGFGPIYEGGKTGLAVSPAELPEVEILAVYDRTGHRATWLERKLDGAELRRITGEAVDDWDMRHEGLL